MRAGPRPRPAAERLLEAGFETVDVERILELVPLATHNQRGRGTLLVGTERRVNAEQLVGIVERSMSAPVYELLKRPDELFVVEHAHLQPRFVEDSVRVALKETLDEYPELADGDFLFSRQVNFETIHTHDVVAERGGTSASCARELEHGGLRSSHQHRPARRGSPDSGPGGFDGSSSSPLVRASAPGAGRAPATRRRNARRLSVPAVGRPPRWLAAAQDAGSRDRPAADDAEDDHRPGPPRRRAATNGSETRARRSRRPRRSA